MDFSLIVTVGPATLKKEILQAINALGPCIFRINGAHASREDVHSITQVLRTCLPSPKIMVDLPGNKVRLTHLKKSIHLEIGKTFELLGEYLNYPDLYKHLKPGTIVLANDSIFTLEVKEIKAGVVTMLSHSAGELKKRKGMHAHGVNDDLPFLFDQDLALIQAACEVQAEYLSLSFVRTAADIREAKKILAERGNTKTEIIAKVETSQAVENLGYIFQEVNAINVDRGDLSASVGMLKLPQVQERIICSAQRANKKIFLATQFLKNMEKLPIPLIAEVIDLHNTVKSGVSGIQLSEETAVGKYPVECVKQVFDVFNTSFSA